MASCSAIRFFHHFLYLCTPKFKPMLQIQLIRENPSEVIERLKVKIFDATELIQKILDTDTQLRQAKRNLDNNLMEQGKIAKSIGQLFKEGKREEAEQMKARTAELKVEEKNLQTELAELPGGSGLRADSFQQSPEGLRGQAANFRRQFHLP